jgi:hypothetical protein
MAKLILNGSTSGSITLESPAVSGTTTLTLPTTTDTLVGKTTTDTLTNKTLTSPVIAGTPTGVGVLTSGTSVSASGTSVDFTSIPSWVKRITVMFNGVSTNGTSNYLVQLGDSGGIENTGYQSVAADRSDETQSTVGFIMSSGTIASIIIDGIMQINLLDSSSNLWAEFGAVSGRDIRIWNFAGSKSLSATLDRVRITTVNGTDTFDAGSINILYE